ncbi:neuroligin-2-like [Bacillus rossius redtenbacheri]|uniref:neuroligin-2-like n=1 Tax=Bacillus rossius redtenbacheri TaxID=93214 RepID=UPI002FDE0173
MSIQYSHIPSESGSREATPPPKYPVLVFIHGESYEWNSGNPYDGSVLASYGRLVVVTVNYRLGVLGFLNARGEAAGEQRRPANYGLMDQVAALHWVQENIAAFGGDPGRVTAVGHGTGAACLHFLMASSAVPDGLLFHRAVLMSGSALAPWAAARDPASRAAQVALDCGCARNHSRPREQQLQLLHCLRQLPAAQLAAAPSPSSRAFSPPAFGPSVDGVVVDDGEPPPPPPPPAAPRSLGAAVALRPLLCTPRPAGGVLELLLRKSAVARLSRYDLMLGAVRAEAYSSFSAGDVQYGVEADRRAAILRAFVADTYRYHQSEILATVVNEYTDWERPVQHPFNIRDETMEALGDAQVVAPVVRTAELHASGRKRPHLYVFEYQTRAGDYPQRQGCVHGEELPYLFGAPLVGGFGHFPRNYTKAEAQLSETVMTYWSNFARTGNPNDPEQGDSGDDSGGGGGQQDATRPRPLEWLPYEPVHKKYLSLDLKPRSRSHYRAHRLSFWLNLVPQLHRPGDDVPLAHHVLDQPGGARPAGGEGGGRSPSSPASSPAPWTSSAAPPAPPPAAPAAPVGDLARYSTALALTVAVGCALLALNALVFAGACYRSRPRLRSPGDGGAAAPAAAAAAAAPREAPAENGRLPNSISADLFRSEEKLQDAEYAGHHRLLEFAAVSFKPPADQ